MPSIPQFRMIGSSEATDVLRNGWTDAAAALAPDVPELSDLLRARLDDAMSAGQMTEDELLTAVDEVASTAALAGSSASPALARRLRRTVYEYLLALDASAAIGGNSEPPELSPLVSTAPPLPPGPPPAPPQPAAAVDGAVELPRTDEPDETPSVAGEHVTKASHRRFGFRRRQLQEGTPPPVKVTGDEAVEDELAGAPPAVDGDPSLAAGRTVRREGLPEPPMWSIHRVKPASTGPEPSGTAPTADHTAAPEASTAPEASPAEDSEADELPSVAVPRPSWYLDRSDLTAHPAEDAADMSDGHAVGTPAQDVVIEPTKVGPAPAQGTAERSADPGHDTADAAQGLPGEATAAAVGGHSAPTSAEPSDDGAAAEETDVTPRFVAPRDGFHIVEGSPAIFDQTSRPAVNTFTMLSLDDADAQPTAGDAAPPVAVQHALAAFDDEFDDDAATWQQPQQAGSHSGALASDRDSPPQPQAGDVKPTEQEPDLAETRRTIADRLRRKRCDEAAAMLQLLAQETGGRQVAELAMDAGDRCRGLGKTNAALNCYLAASRSDPVYELPLSRLADICIDDQDIELAVSYLDRIARLAHMRGDESAALRVYRRIATVAPYREDVLAMLMSAQNGARIEP